MSYTPVPGLNSSGNFTTTCDRYHVLSTGAPKQIALNAAPDFIYWQQIGIPTTGSAWTSALVGPVLKEAWWNSSYPNGYVWAIENTPSAATNQNVFFTTGGFSVFNTAYPMPYAPITGGTSITAANPAVCTIANTFSAGNVVRIQNAVGMEQLNGFLFTISAVTGAGFSLQFLNSSTFSSAATSFSAQMVQIPTFNDIPFANQITAVTSSATSTIITLSVTHNFYVGGVVQSDIRFSTECRGLETDSSGKSLRSMRPQTKSRSTQIAPPFLRLHFPHQLTHRPPPPIKAPLRFFRTVRFPPISRAMRKPLSGICN